MVSQAQQIDFHLYFCGRACNGFISSVYQLIQAPLYNVTICYFEALDQKIAPQHMMTPGH